MKNRICIIAVLFMLVCLSVPGQDSGRLSFTLTPGGTLPIGKSTHYFKLGGGVELSAGLDLASFSLLFFKADLGYTYLGIWCFSNFSGYRRRTQFQSKR